MGCLQMDSNGGCCKWYNKPSGSITERQFNELVDWVSASQVRILLHELLRQVAQISYRCTEVILNSVTAASAFGKDIKLLVTGIELWMYIKLQIQIHL